MKELKAQEKVTQKMTHDGAVTENHATGEVTNISSRDPEAELSGNSEASAAFDMAERVADEHERLKAKKEARADRDTVRESSSARRRPSSRLQFTDEERADLSLRKYVRRSDRAADKLDKTRDAIPTRNVLRKERVFDETAGKGKTRLRFEKVEKEPNGKLLHNPLSQPIREIRATAHGEIRKVEHENVGVEAGHRGEELAEHSISYAGRKVQEGIRQHRMKPWRDAAKAEQAAIHANADFLYQKALHDDPSLAASNPVSRYMQKKRIQRNYAKKLRQAEKKAKNAEAAASSAAKRVKEAAQETAAFVKRHWKGVLIVIAAGAVIILMFGAISSCSVIGGSGTGSVLTSSYLSEDEEMLAAEAAYCDMEAELQAELNNYETRHLGYDEYNFNLDGIGHDPYVLISILSVLHEGMFTVDEVQGELSMLFNSQYILTETVETETRYRTETVTGTRPAIDPETGETITEEFEFEVQIPYPYRICTVTLENLDLSSILEKIMTEEQLAHYELYMSVLGNRPDLFLDYAEGK